MPINLHNETNSVFQSSKTTADPKGRLYLGDKFENIYLTSRETDILKCILRGYSAKQTGLELGLSYRTVESYIENIKVKLHCRKRSEIVSVGLKLGLFHYLN